MRTKLLFGVGVLLLAGGCATYEENDRLLPPVEFKGTDPTAATQPRWSDDPLANSWQVTDVETFEGRCLIWLKPSDTALDPGYIVVPGVEKPVHYGRFRDTGNSCGPQGVNLYSVEFAQSPE